MSRSWTIRLMSVVLRSGAGRGRLLEEPRCGQTGISSRKATPFSSSSAIPRRSSSIATRSKSIRAFPEARLKLAEAYMQGGNGATAFPEYIRAADLLPANTEAQLKAGNSSAPGERRFSKRRRPAADKVLESDG